MTNYPLLDIFLSTLYFFIWILWIMLLFWILMDIFRSDDLSGWGKAGWVIFVIILPFLGVFVYLIARGHSMGERQARDDRACEQRQTGKRCGCQSPRPCSPHGHDLSPAG